MPEPAVAIEADTKPGSDLNAATHGAGILAAAGIVSALGNVGFHVLVARQGGVVRYGSTAALLSFGTIAAAGAAGLQFAIARRTTLNHDSPSASLRSATRAVIPWALVALVLVVLAAPLAAFLNLRGEGPAFAASAFLLAIVASAVPSGVLLGCRRFRTLAGLIVLGAYLRVALGRAIGLEHHGVTKALLASAIAALVTGVVGVGAVVFSDERSRRNLAPAVSEEGELLEGVISASMSAPLLVVWLAPLFFAQHYFPTGAASRFCAAHLVATGILFLLAPVTMAFYPSISEATGARLRAVISRGFAVTVAASVASAALLVAIGPSAIVHTYGSQFVITRYLAAWLGISATVVSVVTYLFWVSRARRRLAFPATAGIAAALLAEIVLGFTYHGAASVLAAEPAFALGFGLIVSLVVVTASRRGIDPGAFASPTLPVPSVHIAVGGLLSQTAVGVMAHNEEKLIGACLDSILDERDGDAMVPLVFVVASACTDRTEDIVRERAERDPRVHLLSEPTRSGKASAINWFVTEADMPILAVVSADVVFAPGALAAMVAALADPNVGMTGGRIVPRNPRKGFTNRLVNAVWDMHHELALVHPKLGEAVVFKRVFVAIDPASLADEVSIEASIRAAGSELRYVPEAEVYNRGPDNLREFVQRRAVCHRGHVQIRETTGYEAASFKTSVVLVAAMHFVRRRPLDVPILGAAAAIENIARLRGRLSHEMTRPMEKGIWAPAASARQEGVDEPVLEAPGVEPLVPSKL